MSKTEEKEISHAFIGLGITMIIIVYILFSLSIWSNLSFTLSEKYFFQGLLTVFEPLSGLMFMAFCISDDKEEEENNE